MFRNKFFAALPFLHDLDDSNLEEAFPTISDSPDGRDFKGSKVKQAIPSASGIRCGISIETTTTPPLPSAPTPIFFHHPSDDLPSTFDDAATCTFRALILKPSSEAASKAVAAVKAGLNGVSSSQETANQTSPNDKSTPTMPILVFTFASSSQPFMVDPLHIKQVRLEEPTAALPPSLVFVFDTVIFRTYEIAETYMTPGDDVKESMQVSYQRLSASYEEIKCFLDSYKVKGNENSLESVTLTVNQTRKLVTEGRFVPDSKQASPETSICSNNKQGGQAQESEKLTDEVILDPIPSSGGEAATVEAPKNASIEDIMLRPEVLLEKAEKLAPAAKKRRLAKESAKRLITNILSPKTIPSLNIVEASRYLSEGYLEKLGGEGQASSSMTPNSELSHQLNKCAEEIKNTHVTLSEDDTFQVKEMTDRIAKCKENLDIMIRKAYKVVGKGNKKRKSIDGEAAGRIEEAVGAVPGEEDVKAGFEEILVATRAKNLLLWG
ncbi:hypothetical protein TrRE_jg4474 [Triparma retinervis]|uniref:Uncharacterized protein n=1 Tax=Triparma retinervis TaxID=2557542 RepID=A0A9W7AKD8_9STRA|nr:hypothetical protein TrRE_jg4474 [Triparma retinervis]